MTDRLDRYQACAFATAEDRGTAVTRRARLARWIVMLTPTARRIERQERTDG